MFDFFKFKKNLENADPKNIVSLPVDYIKPVEPPKPKEHYRVGFDDQGMTTLTLIADHGNSMTLSMNQDACEQLIKMLRATYPNETE